MRLFLYRDNHRYTVLQTGGDPAKLNTWAVGVPQLLKAGGDAVVSSNNDKLWARKVSHIRQRVQCQP